MWVVFLLHSHLHWVRLRCSLFLGTRRSKGLRDGPWAAFMMWCLYPHPISGDIHKGTSNVKGASSSLRKLQCPPTLKVRSIVDATIDIGLWFGWNVLTQNRRVKSYPSPSKATRKQWPSQHFFPQRFPHLNYCRCSISYTHFITDLDLLFFFETGCHISLVWPQILCMDEKCLNSWVSSTHDSLASIHQRWRL